MEMDGQMQRKNERQERDNQREDPNIAVAPRKKHQQQAARQRHERHQRENDGTEAVSAHRASIHIQIMKAITTAEPAAIHPAYERMFPDCMWRTSSETWRAPSPASFTAASIMFRSTPCQRIRVEPSISGLPKRAA